MSDVSFTTINNLEETSLIAGNDFTFQFEVFDDNGSPLNLSGATTYLLFSPYGQTDYKEIQLTGNILTENTFEFVLPSTSSRNLDGWYIQQVAIISFDGTEYRPAQGMVFFGTRTPYT